MALMAKTILWVDDEAELLEPHRLLLGDKGYHVETATNADDALELLRRRPYDLVLLDLVMPDIDGIEVMRRVRGTFDPPYRDVQVVALTANVAEDALKTCLAVGISEVMPKPFDRLSLVNTVIRHSTRPQAGAAPAPKA